MALLSNILSPSTRSRESLVLIQSTLATPWLPLLHTILNATNTSIICVCMLHPPATLLPAHLSERERDRVKIVDWTSHIPGYEDDETFGGEEQLLKNVRTAVDELPEGPLTLVVDSPDTLCDDVGSPSKTYYLLNSWYSTIASRPAPSRLILFLPSQSRLLPLLLTPTFVPSIAHLILHPPSLLLHLSLEYLTLPPPHSSPAKFWPVFSGLASRGEAERLVWGVNGAGWGSEMVVEVIARSSGGKRSVDRSLEGWRQAGPCRLEELEELKPIWVRGTGTQAQATADPTHNLSFNLNLTEAQQHSRAQVPLPYAHEGQPAAGRSNAGSIFYDPDSADDIDEDDPDEDLDI